MASTYHPARAAAVLGLALVLAGCSIAGAGVPAPSLSVCALPSNERLVPEDGTLFGVNLDWGHEQLRHYAGRLGRNPAVAVSFTDFPLTESGVTNLDGASNS